MVDKKELYTTKYTIPDAFIETVTSSGDLVELDTNKNLYQMGDQAEHVYFVLSGFLESSCLYDNGNRILIDTYSDGSFFGYEESLVDQMRTVNVQAIKHSSLIKITKDSFFNLIFSDQRLSEIILKKIADEARTLTIRLSNSSCLSPRHLIIRDILNRVWNQNNKMTIQVPARKLWSSYLGVTRETLARVLSKLSKDEWIEILDTNHLSVKNLDAMSTYSEHEASAFRQQ